MRPSDKQLKSFNGLSLPKEIRKVARKEMNKIGEELVLRAELARVFMSIKALVTDGYDKSKFVSKDAELKAAQETFVDAGERIIEIVRK